MAKISGPQGANLPEAKDLDPMNLPLPTRFARFAENVKSHLTRLNNSLQDELRRRSADDVPRQLYLRSSGGKIYEVIVNDAGVLSTVMKYDGTP